MKPGQAPQQLHTHRSSVHILEPHMVWAWRPLLAVLTNTMGRRVLVHQLTTLEHRPPWSVVPNLRPRHTRTRTPECANAQVYRRYTSVRVKRDAAEVGRRGPAVIDDLKGGYKKLYGGHGLTVTAR